MMAISVIRSDDSHVPRHSSDAEVVTQSPWIEFSGRLPADLYRDAADLSLMLNQSLSEYLGRAVSAYIDAQLARSIVAGAVGQLRAARQARNPSRDHPAV